jgi:hypothetical protein
MYVRSLQNRQRREKCLHDFIFLRGGVNVRALIGDSNKVAAISIT